MAFPYAHLALPCVHQAFCEPGFSLCLPHSSTPVRPTTLRAKPRHVLTIHVFVEAIADSQVRSEKEYFAS